MSKKKLYATATDTSDIRAITVSHNHSSAFSQAIINAKTTGLSIGDSVTVNMGYEGDYGKIFTGYVKETNKTYPEGLWSITAHDVMVRAVDYFVVSSNPEKPFKRRNIKAEILVKDVLKLAGLTNYTYQNTHYTLAITTAAEVNLISAYDYCNSIADLLAWHLWADINGQVHFENRKPYFMTSKPIPGHDADPTPTETLTDDNTLNVSSILSEKDLRNRIVVYGAEGIYAEAKSSTSYDPEDQSTKAILPAGYYKSVVFATPIIDKTSVAKDTADFNLDFLNRLNYQVNVTAEGNYNLIARSGVKLTNTELGISNRSFYIFSSEHQWSERGYTTFLELRA